MSALARRRCWRLSGNVPDNRKRLNDQQQAVLAWIGAGCPAGMMTGTTYKTTAVALQNRRLVTISRQRGRWTAEPTTDGTYYVAHGAYPPADRSHRTPRTPRTPRPKRAAPAPARAPAHDAADPSTAVQRPARDPAQGTAPGSPRSGPRKPGPAQRLVDDVQAAGGVLVVQRPAWVDGRPTGVDYDTLAQAANRYRKVPPGTRLTTRTLPWPDMEVRLEPDEASWPATPQPVPVPAQVAAYHPAVAAFRDRTERHEVSPAQLPRACRLLHALAVEAERRTHTAAVASDPPSRYLSSSWSSTVNGHLTITVAGRPYALRIREDGLSARGAFNRTNPPGTPYPTRAGTGQLHLAIVGYSSGDGHVGRWADGKHDRLEDKLPAVLAELERRVAADHRIFEQVNQPIRDAEDRRRTARAHARAAYIETERARHFTDQVRRWQLTPHATEFLAAARDEITRRAADGQDVTAAEQWLTWAEQHVTNLDPLRGELALPAVTEPTPEQLRPFLPPSDPPPRP